MTAFKTNIKKHPEIVIRESGDVVLTGVPRLTGGTKNIAITSKEQAAEITSLATDIATGRAIMITQHGVSG